ncbi:hypothetical protein F9U64_08675 [Gracilibacillus oryzae]|uniref:Uncharacterized protein n=2 Tax=Gracilibacillus oryzae TaxID=1672701 RepID=A0A7C8KZV6_9BACI|nr:hypothetical protein F9U64_08675 [Gracilibacillus oryzae]
MQNETTDSSENTPIIAEVQQGEFIYRLITEQESYQTGEDVKLFAELEYVGNKQEITIYHAASPFSFPIKELTAGYEIGYPMNEPLLTTTIKKGEPLRQQYEVAGSYSEADDKDYIAFMKDFLENSFPEGKYKVNGIADFYTNGENDDQKTDYQMEAKIEFEVME